MSDLPCKNPNCNSYGQPHPNCKCYGGMAGGGETIHCANGKPHKEGCQYFADGGSAESDYFDDSPAPASDSDYFNDNAAPEASAVDQTETSAQPNDIASSMEPGKPGLGIFAAEKPQDEDYFDDSQPTSEDKYGTLGQGELAAVEHLAKGFAGPVAVAAEKGLSDLGVPGLTNEDIIGRTEANPKTSAAFETAGLGLGLTTGAGELGLLAKGAKAIPGLSAMAEMGKLGNAGSKAIQALVSNAAFQGGDEISQHLLGQGNPADAAALHIATMGGLGLLTGGISGAIEEPAIKAMQEAKLGTKMASWLGGAGHEATASPEVQENIFSQLGDAFDKKAFQQGQKFYRTTVPLLLHSASGLGGAAAGAKLGYEQHGVGGALTGAAAGLVGGIVSSKVITPVLLNALSKGTSLGLFEAIDHGKNVAKGLNGLNLGIDAIMKGGGAAAIRGYEDPKKREKLNGLLDDNYFDQDIKQQALEPSPQGFAEGGTVEAPKGVDAGLGAQYPTQNILINAAKGRVSNYLRSLKPQNDGPKLAFDEAADTNSQKKRYDKALDIANTPLGVLNEIGKGTLEPDHITHLGSMYPELHDLMQKKITQSISEAQLKNQKPPYKIRQGLSLFMGTPLMGEMHPQNIQAAQAVFSSQQAPQMQAPPTKKKRDTAPLSKSDEAFLTPSQSRSKSQQASG